MRAGILGTGRVGSRAGAHLAELDGLERILVDDTDPARAAAVVAGAGAIAIPSGVTPDADLDAVVLATPDETQPRLARQFLAAGHLVVATASSPEAVDALLTYDGLARDHDTAVIVGCAFSPGMSSVLTAHAAALFAEVHEVHVAMYGAGGAACLRRRVGAARDDVLEWRDGEWETFGARSGRELLWFPDPIGERDCYRGALSEARLVHRMLPSADRLSARMALPEEEGSMRLLMSLRRGSRPTLAPGAIRVEVRGRTEESMDTVVYGAAAEPGDAAGLMAAVAAVHAFRGGVRGSLGAGEIGLARDLLMDVSRRGVTPVVLDPTT